MTEKTDKTDDVSREPIEGEWQGHPIWICPICGFDTENAAVLADHLRAVHHEPEGANPPEEEEAAPEEAAPVAAVAPPKPGPLPPPPEPPAQEIVAEPSIEPEPDENA